MLNRIAIFLRLVGRWYWAKGSAADDGHNFRVGPALAWKLAGILAEEK